jgi:hypothetical protein
VSLHVYLYLPTYLPAYLPIYLLPVAEERDPLSLLIHPPLTFSHCSCRAKPTADPLSEHDNSPGRACPLNDGLGRNVRLHLGGYSAVG